MANYDMTREAWMRNQERYREAATGKWHWPLDPGCYDRRPGLNEGERVALSALADHLESGRLRDAYQLARPAVLTASPLTRLIVPLCDTLDVIGAFKAIRQMTLRVLLLEMHRHQAVCWGWSQRDWLDVLGADAEMFRKKYRVARECRQQVVACSYLLGGCVDLRPGIDSVALATTIFGPVSVEHAVRRVEEALRDIGLLPFPQLAHLLCLLLLSSRSPLLDDVTFASVEDIYQHGVSLSYKPDLNRVSRALVHMGVLENSVGLSAHIHAEWSQLCRRWYRDSPLAATTRREYYIFLLRIGRWLTHNFPEVHTPEQWTTDIADACAEAVVQMEVGQWTGRKRPHCTRSVVALETRRRCMQALRTFFRDCQHWDKLTYPFEPRRHFSLSSRRKSGR